MAATKRAGLFPFTEQEPFLGDDHRYYGYVSGVGAGKTHGGMMRAALNMERWNVGHMGAIVAPTTTMVKNVILPLMRQTGLMERWEYKSMHTDEPGIHVPNGSRALILSADNRKTMERLAGLNLAWFWLDEASRVDARAFEILTQRLREGEYQNGFVTTTPMGKNYLHDFFVDEDDGVDYKHGEADVHEHGRGDRLAILRVPTWANPFTGAEYKEDMETKEGQVYEREILGRFVDYEGLVYRWFDPETHVIPYDAEEHDTPLDALPDNVRTLLYGVDWGRTHPFAISVIAHTVNDAYYVIDEVYQTGLDYGEMVDVATNLQARYGRGRWWCDPAEPAAIDMFQKAGLDAQGAENAIMPGIQYVSAQRDSFGILSTCQELRNEFGLYHYPDDGGDETPVDANNHLLDSVRYALMGHREHGEPSVGVAFG